MSLLRTAKNLARPLALALPLCAALGLGGAGCKQEVGDRCQLDTDCDTNLTCIIPAGTTRAQGGVCQAAFNADAGFGDLMFTEIIDLSAKQDAAAVDAAKATGADLATAPSADLATAPSADLATAATVDLALPLDGQAPDLSH